MKKFTIYSLFLVPLMAGLPFLTGCCASAYAKSTKDKRYAAAEHPVPTPLPSTTPLPVRDTVITADSLELKCEQAVPVKQVQTQQVSIRKVVETQNVLIPVTLSHDEYVVERTPITGAPQTPFAEAQTSLVLSRETASVSVVPVVNELVRLRKVTVQTTTNLAATIRCEKLVLDKP